MEKKIKDTKRIMLKAEIDLMLLRKGMEIKDEINELLGMLSMYGMDKDRTMMVLEAANELREDIQRVETKCQDMLSTRSAVGS
jgi:hypothetical protein